METHVKGLELAPNMGTCRNGGTDTDGQTHPLIQVQDNKKLHNLKGVIKADDGSPD